jgi:predicted amidophosphoribosyltransferase
MGDTQTDEQAVRQAADRREELRGAFGIFANSCENDKKIIII